MTEETYIEMLDEWIQNQEREVGEARIALARSEGYLSALIGFRGMVRVREAAKARVAQHRASLSTSAKKRVEE